MEDYIFQLSASSDGAVTYTKMFNNALDAVRVYNSFVDYGFARYEREIVLVEPNGKVHTKIFQVPYAMAMSHKKGECICPELA
jgi:hypothetical protein